MIKVGIIGGSGCTGGELIRLLLNHPEVELIFIHSRRHLGKLVTDVHKGLLGETSLTFTDDMPLDKVDVIFLCLPAGESHRFMACHNLPEALKVIDLSIDFRLKEDGDVPFIYGLPELNRRATCTSSRVANPGACATGILLGLLPLAKHLMLNSDIYVHSVVGRTYVGARMSDEAKSRNYGLGFSVLQPVPHPDIPEVKESLQQLQTSFNSEVHCVPCLGGFSRGVFTTLMVKTKVELNELVGLYEDYYDRDSFTFVVPQNIDVNQVVNTNKCLIHLEKKDNMLLIVTCIDNLLKGSAGQAVHNMNLLFNLEETVGLRLKASAY